MCQEKQNKINNSTTKDLRVIKKNVEFNLSSIKKIYPFINAMKLTKKNPKKT